VSKRLNAEMVKVYPLVECDDSEILEVRDLVARHIDYTGSKRGKEILDDWDVHLNKLLKVLPEDYERVLVAMRKAEERGLKGDEAIQAAFEENVAAGH
jgi:glutamate synthase (ferredoxin)